MLASRFHVRHPFHDECKAVGCGMAGRLYRLVPYFGGESEGNKMYVWVVEDNKVHKREVTVNAPTGEAQALISEGLKPGEKIVIAGVYQLVEGESITTVDR